MSTTTTPDAPIVLTPAPAPVQSAALITLDSAATRLAAHDQLLADVERAKEFATVSRPHNTERAAESDWRHFAAYCAARQIASLPAQPPAVAAYLAHLAESCAKCQRQAQIAARRHQTPQPHSGQHERYKVSTLRRRLAIISKQHQQYGYPSPTGAPIIAATLDGIMKRYGSAQQGKDPITDELVKPMLKQAPATLAGARDRALLLIGLASAMRRSELAALDLADLAITPDGAIVTIRRSKTDQAGEGRELAIQRGHSAKTCPIAALEALIALLAAHDITAGPVFRAINRHGQISQQPLDPGSIARIVKRYARAIGLNAARYGAHSLRAGLVTSILDNGGTLDDAMTQTGHKHRRTTRRYDRGKNRMKRSPTRLLKL